MDAATPHEEGATGERDAGENAGAARRWRPSAAALGAFLVAAAITAVLSVTSLILYKHNERRLLNLRAREVSLVLSAAVTSVQTPVASGAALADSTAGDLRRFRTFMAPFVGTGRQFASISLWRLGAEPRPLVVLGATPQSLPQLGPTIQRLARRSDTLNLTGMLERAKPSLGFAYRAGASSNYLVYAENPLPANRRSKLESNSAFSDLNYVIYLGRSQRNRDLLLSSVKTLPVHGLQSSRVVPFGSGAFTLVVTPRGSLSGSFFDSVPWITALVGLLVALFAAALTDRLVRGRRRAEQLARRLDQVASETRERYIEQRSIAQTLQHELLPQKLPEMAGLRVNARYVPAQAGGDIGGDWYDIVPLDGDRGLLVIGDVSGHGVQAATTMALVRHATLAYVAEDYRPGVVLAKLSDFVRSRTNDYFATVLCGLISVDEHRVTFASAGHLAPLLLNGEEGRFVKLEPEAPIGFPHGAPLRETTVDVPAAATLVAFTDGLVERRGEVLDEGLERLRSAALAAHMRDAQLLARLAEELTSEDHRDDTALVSVRWQN
ncbi:MAG TPA: PP2C family protein-serine/threonine phosphatase [Solirubrobacteraceae bacterium]